MYNYTEKQMYLLGQVYRCLTDILSPHSGNLNADIFPIKYLIMILIRIPHNKIPKRVDSALMKIMNDITEEEMEELIANPSPTPMELRVSWQLGYSDGWKLIQPSPISKKRKELKMTQEDLAKIIGCTQKDISRWENDYFTPNAENLQKLAKTFSCTVDDLL